MDADTGVENDQSMKRNRKLKPQQQLIRTSTNGTAVVTMVTLTAIVITTDTGVVVVTQTTPIKKPRKIIILDGDIIAGTTTADIRTVIILITTAVTIHRLILIPIVTKSISYDKGFGANTFLFGAF
jgi:hypothetical protein